MSAVAARRGYDAGLCRDWDPGLDGDAERGWWDRVGTSAVLVVANVGWTSLWAATVLAAPISLALAARRRPAAPGERRDDF